MSLRERLEAIGLTKNQLAAALMKDPRDIEYLLARVSIKPEIRNVAAYVAVGIRDLPDLDDNVNAAEGADNDGEAEQGQPIYTPPVEQTQAEIHAEAKAQAEAATTQQLQAQLAGAHQAAFPFPRYLTSIWQEELDRRRGQTEAA